MQKRIALWLTAWITLCVAVLFPILIGNQFDLEDYLSTIVSSVYHSQALFAGRYPYWISELGLGIPHPSSQYYIFHPFFFLFGLIPTWLSIPLLYLGHMLLGSGSIYAICRHQGASRTASNMAGLAFILASPSLQYALTDFWPIEFTGWTIAPLVLYLLIRFLDETEPKKIWGFALLSGVMAALLVQNGHLGHVPTFILAFSGFAVLHSRRLLTRWKAVLLLAGVALAIGSGKLIHVLNEYSLFDPNLEKVTPPSSLAWDQVYDIFLYPYRTGSHESFWSAAKLYPRVRMGFGGPFMFLAVLGMLVGLFRKDRIRWIAFASAAIFSLYMVSVREDKVFHVLSWTFLFRDPFIILALPLGALGWDSMVRAFRGKRWIYASVGALQVFALVSAAWPYWKELVDLGWRPAYCTVAYLNTGREPGFIEALRENTRDGRVYFTPPVETGLNGISFCRAGAYTNTLAIDGVRVVNGIFKGVSVGAIHPDQRIPYGQIKGQETLSKNLTTLQVLNFRYLIKPYDLGKDFPGLEHVKHLGQGHPDVHLFRVKDAWPDAVFISDLARTTHLSKTPGCEHDRFLCSDFSPLLKLRTPDGPPIEIGRNFSRISLQFPASPQARTIYVSEMYRPGWKAWSPDASLEVFPLFDHLVGIQVPAGVSQVTLEYRPTREVWMTWVAWITLLGSLGGAWFISGSRKPSPSGA